MNQEPRGWWTRGYLPHFEGGEVTQFITIRLANTLPQLMLRKLRFRLDSHQISEIEYHREIEKYLDKGHGPTYLRVSAIAELVEENLIEFDGERYQLLHWIIMPNHVHILLTLLKNIALSRVIHSIKSYTANRANKILKRTGSFWSVDYFDRYIRNNEHYERTVRYIHANPVKAGLCEEAVDWPFGCRRLHG